MQQPFPDPWEQILRKHIAFLKTLDELGSAWFRQLTQIFLNEVVITGIRTEADDTIRALVEARRRSRHSVSTTGNTIDCVRC